MEIEQKYCTIEYQAVQMFSSKIFIKCFTPILIPLVFFLNSCSERSEYGEASDYEKYGYDNRPTVTSVSPTDNSTDVAISTTPVVTFSKKISTSTATANTSDTTCSGSFQLSSDNFTTCVQMSATPSASNDDKTITSTPADNLISLTTYRHKVTTAAKDRGGNSLAEAYTTNGFTTMAAGTFKGSVKKADGDALSGVLVDFSGANVDNTTTDSSGDFNKILGLGSYTLTYSKSGYITTTQAATLATDKVTVIVATLTLLDNSCSAGDIAGTIKDAVTGSAISGVSISIRSGVNVTSGSTISGKTATSANSNGTYTISSVDAGGYTVEASVSGYITSYFIVYVCGNVSNQNANLSATLPSGSMRIVLSWKGTDDLDGHLEIPVSDDQDGASDKTDGTHLFFITNQTNAITYSGISTYDYHIYGTGDNVTLDQDNKGGPATPCLESGSKCGPETITISKIMSSGAYRYHVHNFTRRRSTDNSELGDSEATVNVLYNNELTTFYVPKEAGNLWTIFDFDNSSGFNPLNIMADESSYLNVDDH